MVKSISILIEHSTNKLPISFVKQKVTVNHYGKVSIVQKEYNENEKTTYVTNSTSGVVKKKDALSFLERAEKVLRKNMISENTVTYNDYSCTITIKYDSETVKGKLKDIPYNIPDVEKTFYELEQCLDADIVFFIG